jgi:hypothetical protein
MIAGAGALFSGLLIHKLRQSVPTARVYADVGCVSASASCAAHPNAVTPNHAKRAPNRQMHAKRTPTARQPLAVSDSRPPASLS